MSVADIRAGTTADFALLPAIEDDADRRFELWGYGFCRDVDCLDSLAAARGLAEGLLWLAVVDGKPVGFACGWTVDGQGHLAELSVLGAHGGRGIGRSLLQAFEHAARARGHRRVTLLTYIDVPWNAPWYRRQGYEAFVPDTRMPELLALCADEQVRGIEQAPRTAMVKHF